MEEKAEKTYKVLLTEQKTGVATFSNLTLKQAESIAEKLHNGGISVTSGYEVEIVEEG
jgi:ATP-dependent Clp protease adapter protein ClpS